jgi:hypothetical protein
MPGMFSIKAYQDLKVDPNGWCQLRIQGLPLTMPEALELNFKRAGSAKPFLAERGWQENAIWLPFEDVNLMEGAVVLRIGPSQTKFLSQVTTIEVGVRRLGQQADPAHRARVVWPSIILEVEDHLGTAPVSGAAEPPAPQPEVTAPTFVPDLRTVPTEDRIVHPATEAHPTRRRRWLFVGLGLALIPAAVAAAYFLELPPFKTAVSDGEASPIVAGRAFTEEEVRQFLAESPDATDSVAEAQAYQEAGHPDLALLIYRYAQRQGSPAAAKAIGRMYDPESYNRETSPFPAADADQATEYYRRAAESGDVEAQYLLGRLLVSGTTSGEDDVERGVVWLDRAAKGGQAEAAQLLSQMTKEPATGGN